jgi:hypothetical protein
VQLTRDQTEELLFAAHQWLDSPGALLPGAAVAKRAIVSLFASFSAGAIATPENEEELVDMIVWEGRLHCDATASDRRYVTFLPAIAWATQSLSAASANI